MKELSHFRIGPVPPGSEPGNSSFSIILNLVSPPCPPTFQSPLKTPLNYGASASLVRALFQVPMEIKQRTDHINPCRHGTYVPAGRQAGKEMGV